MILAMLLSLAAQDAAPRTSDAPYRPAPATIVAEPVALFLAALDRDRDGRTTAAELREGLEENSRGTPGLADGIGYLAYSDWAERYLGDRNAVPTPFDIDRNGDNKVTAAELSDRFDAIFARLDANRDGAVTRAELLTIRNSAIGRPDREERGERRRGRTR